MSFIEKNKAWILPLLGVGVAAVVWMNIRTFTAPAAPAGAPQETAPSAAESSAPAAPAAPPVEAPVSTQGANAGGADLWEDLRALAAPPPALANEASFRDAGRRSALAALRPTPLPKGVPVPTGVREPRPSPEPKAAMADAPEAPPPSLDFLIHGSSGSRAWFEGRSYRTGDPVGPPQRAVGAIGTTTVELKSPKGKTVLSTNPFHHSGPAPRPAVEAP